MTTSLLLHPIGFARTPFAEKAQAPRQAVAGSGEGAEGTIEVLPEHAHALADLEGFDRIWILFWFHEAARASGKVLPPRSATKRGVFATRSPHRPNPIGLSAVRLVGVEGLVVRVRDLDLVDGTPILDIKPYIAYADAFPDASTGWLAAPEDPRAAWTVSFGPDAEAALAFLDGERAIDEPGGLRQRLVDALALGPHPHPYRRIKRGADGSSVVAVKDWRARFIVDAHALADGRTITVVAIHSGYRERAIDADPALGLHRAFVARFGK